MKNGCKVYRFSYLTEEKIIMKKKLTLIIAGLVAGTALFAGTINGSFTPANSEVKKKHPDSFVSTKDQLVLKGIPGMTWMAFDTTGIKSEQGKTICITLTAKGKGKVYAGYYGYRSGFSLEKQEDKLLTLTDKPTEFKLEFPLAQTVKIVRPRFRVTPDSEITVTDIKAEIK